MNSSPSKAGNQPPPSPWKKPKIVSLSRSKSLKRKTDLFSTKNTDSENNPSLDQINDSPSSSRTAKIGKTIFNRFSINNSLNSFNTNLTSSDSSVDKNDLFSFFNGNKEINEFDNQNIENLQKPKTNERLTTLCPQIIKNICSSLSSSNQFNLSIPSKAEEKEQPKIIYQFENEQLIPIDWSLKKRVRFLSTRPFTCYNGIKSSHESEAILNYSKFNSFYNNLLKHKFNTNEQNKDLFKTLFCESISYWTFPYLPWLNLYPRNINLGNLSSEPLNLDIQKTLSKTWNASFKSLYNSLKSNQCPYFYVLTHSFVVLFKAENIDGTDEMTAILTPSTKGLRQSLKDINFTMPLAPANNGMKKSESGDLKNNDSSNSNEGNNELSNKNLNTTSEENDSTNCILNGSGLGDDDKKSEKEKSVNDNDNEEEDENDDDTEEPDEWLEQIGLNSTVNFKASVLQRNNKNAQKDSLFNFDNRPRSTLYFSEGGDVQALFNFLLNSKTCISSSGPLTGIPPTLIAPLPFVGATLQKIKVEQNVIKSLNSAGEPITQYAIDLIGPLMPYHIHRLCNLFRITQVDNFNMVANLYDQTAALNCVKKEERTELSNGLYLDMSESKSLENNYGINGEAQAIKSISLIDNNFCCNF